LSWAEGSIVAPLSCSTLLSTRIGRRFCGHGGYSGGKAATGFAYYLHIT
jgi:hypothetical protein